MFISTQNRNAAKCPFTLALAGLRIVSKEGDTHSSAVFCSIFALTKDVVAIAAD